jgi:hypothetical protein
VKFVHHDLGHVNAGDTVEVTLSGNAANVRLMDSSDTASCTRPFTWKMALHGPLRPPCSAAGAP